MTLVDEGHPGARAVTVWTLQLLDPSEVVPGQLPTFAVEWQRVDGDKAELSGHFSLSKSCHACNHCVVSTPIAAPSE